MADNFAFTPGVGKTGAADEIDGVLYPRVKIAVGANNTNDGDVSSTNPMPITGTVTADLGANNDVTVTGSVTANAGTNLNTSALALETGGNLAAIKAKTDNIPALGQALAASSVPVVLTAAQLTTLTPPAAITGFALETGGNLAAAATSLGTLDNIVSGSEAQVDVVAALPAGTNLLGKVSIDQVTANANEVVTKSGSVTTATLNAETTKVIGTVNVAANQTIAVTNAGTFATQATLQAGTAAIGKLAANSGVDIGDVDVTSLPALAAGTNNIGDVDVASITCGSITGPAAPVIDSYTHAAINLAAGANQVLVSSSASHQIWVYGIHFVVNAAGTVSFQDEDDTAISGVMPFAANSGMAVAPSGNFSMPIWKLATDKDLEVDIVTSEVDGWIDYAIVNA